MSSRQLLRSALADAILDVQKVRQTCVLANRSLRRSVAARAKGRKAPASQARLLSLVAVYAEESEDVVALVAVMMGLASVQEATASGWVCRRASALAESRQPGAVAWARNQAHAWPVLPVTAKAQRLVAETRVALWAVRMNRRGVAPLAEQLLDKLRAEWPSGALGRVDRTWLERLSRSPSARKNWTGSFKRRWGLQWRSLPRRAFVEPEERTRRAPGPFLGVAEWGVCEPPKRLPKNGPKPEKKTSFEDRFWGHFLTPVFGPRLYVLLMRDRFWGSFFDPKNGPRKPSENKPRARPKLSPGTRVPAVDDLALPDSPRGWSAHRP